MMNRSKLAIAVTALVLVAACRKTDEPVVSSTAQGTGVSPAGTTAAKEGLSMVRFVNALPARNKVDFSGDDRTLFDDVKYRSVTPYAEVKSNLLAFHLLGGGKDSVIAENHEAMHDGARYTAVAMPDGKGGAQVKVYKDDIVPSEGKAELRVINASPRVKNVDVAVLGQKDALISGVDFGDDGGYKEFAPATTTLELRRKEAGAKPVLLKDLHFAAGKSYTLVIIGSSSEPTTAFTFEDEAVPVRLSSRP
jgi:hypothetical protein